MDKRAIQKFAVEARRKLTKAVIQKAYQFGITEQKKEAISLPDGLVINGVPYQQFYQRQYQRLLVRIQVENFHDLIEEVTYTWFNRFIALRFMEINDYLPIRRRILSSEQAGKNEPDAISNAHELIDVLGLEREVIYRLQDENKSNELFKYIVTKQCNALGELIPNVFQPIADEIELLFPDNVLQEGGVVYDLIRMIPEDDWQDVEIIGWLYQFYIAEEKDKVFANARTQKIGKAELAPATQFFTPEWIVQYLIDNSLGQLWLEQSKDERFAQHLSYYIKPSSQPEKVGATLAELNQLGLSAEAIKVIDPSVGSGHILVYAFDVLYAIYQQQGYAEGDIPTHILKHNLFGLDIDKRAVQLATFALVMKARKKNRRLFRQPLQLNITAIEESNRLSDEDVELFVGDTDLRHEVNQLVTVFHDAKLYGSLLELPPIEWGKLEHLATEWEQQVPEDLFELNFKERILPLFSQLIHQGKILQSRYDLVTTNPPYMGRGNMNAALSKYVEKRYPDSKADLYAMFMEVTSRLAKDSGFIAMINMHSWMFLSSFEKLRQKILAEHQIYSMAHLGTRAFAEISGEVVQTTSFVLRKQSIPDYQATFVRLVDIKNAERKPLHLHDEDKRYIRTQDGFTDIPGAPIAYWASEQVRENFKKNQKILNVGETRVGVSTGNNDLFTRFWFEVDINDTDFQRNPHSDSDKKWFPYNKGGTFNRWYGNLMHLIDWYNNGKNIKDYGKGVVRNPNYYFREGITWSDISSSSFSARISYNGAIFGTVGLMLFSNHNLNYILGYMNSKVFAEFANYTMSTLHFNPKEVSQQPFKGFIHENKIDNIVFQNISLSKTDWDSFETSWEFKQHPFLTYRNAATTIEAVFSNWSSHAQVQFHQLKANEEELNRIFIDLYEMQDELTPEVADKEVTVRKADLDRDIRSFLSYCVGLMFGRYSLDEPGLIFAGGEWQPDKYPSFTPVRDNIIPITDEQYFDDDIVTKISELVARIFGAEQLERNLDFIADSLTRKGTETARERIYRYFVKEFYKDHLKAYQKRPIYWLFTSGKQNGFQALIYLQRYDRDTVARVRTDYLHVLERKMEDELNRLEATLTGEAAPREKTQVKKQKEKITKQLSEMRSYDEIIAYQADHRLELDMDDGVKVNYAKFQEIEVPQEDGNVKKANLLANI